VVLYLGARSHPDGTTAILDFTSDHCPRSRFPLSSGGVVEIAGFDDVSSLKSLPEYNMGGNGVHIMQAGVAMIIAVFFYSMLQYSYA
jgi:hypothetical protein